MKTGMQALLALSLLAGLTATASLAAETPAASSEASASSVLDNLYLNYFATFHGPSVRSLDSPYAVDRMGVPSSKFGIYFDSEVTAAYMVAPSIGVGPVVPFILTPVMGQGFILGDVGVKAFNRKTVSTPNFSLYTNLILQAPTSQSSQDRNMSFAIKTTPNFRYVIPETRFSVGAWTEAKAYLGVSAGQSLKFYAAPYVNYKLSRSFSLNLEFEADSRNNVANSAAGFSLYQADWQPGFVWNISHGVLVNPYLQIFTTNAASLDHSALGMVISASLL